MSLTARLLLLVVGLLSAVLLGLWLYLGGAVSQWALQAQDEELDRRAAVIASAVKLEDSGELELDDEDHDGAAVGQSGWPFRIETLEGEVLLKRALDWPAPGGPLGARTLTTPAGTELRVLARAFLPPRGARQLVVRVAAPTAAFSALAARIGTGLAVALVFGLALGGLGAVAIARVFLAPLRRLSDQVGKIEARSLDLRLPTASQPPELARLAVAFNAVLDRLEAAFDRQRVFVGRASHSLRTPVTSILAQAEVALRRERSPEEYREALGGIAQAARESATLTDGLLAQSRADASASELRLETLPLASVTDELRQLFAARLEQAGVTFEVEVEPKLAVVGDRVRLRELLEALLDNAVTYTPRGGRVGVRARATAGGRELQVWDTGPGIPPDERAHVFERFFRGGAAQRSQKTGSGLGLAIVEAIARAHGGTVAAGEEPGGGARLTVRLPARPPPL